MTVGERLLAFLLAALTLVGAALAVLTVTLAAASNTLLYIIEKSLTP